VDGVVAHTAGANGNLMFNVQSSSPARTVRVTTSAGTAAQSTRIYTNNHEQGCGLSGMGAGGFAVLEVEWADPSNRYSLRYGKSCTGVVAAAGRIVTARSGSVWTLSSTASAGGILCSGRLTGKPNWTTVVGVTAGAFTMTLTG
jgi:hypothetical protein